MVALQAKPIMDAEPTPAFEEQVRVIFRNWSTGNMAFRDAIDQLTQFGQEAQSTGHIANQARVEHMLGYVQHDRGNLNTSLMHFERARALFEQVGNMQRIAMMDLNLGEVYRYKGDFTRARHLYRKAYEVASKLQLLELRTLALANEGQMLLNMERYDQAWSSLTEAYHLTTQWAPNPEQSVENIRTEIHCALAEIDLHRGEFTAAWAQAQHALENAEASQLPILAGVANRVIGDVLSTNAELPNVDRNSYSADPDLYYQRAIAILREMRADAELAHTMFAFGQSLAQRGRQLNAARQLQQAMIVYTRLDMVADAAKAARAQLDVTA